MATGDRELSAGAFRDREREQATKWGMTLDEWIEHLLRIGKRRKHSEFQELFTIFGEKKIEEKAKSILFRIREPSP